MIVSASPLAAAIAMMPTHQAPPRQPEEQTTVVVCGRTWRGFHTNSTYLVVVALLAILVITLVLPQYWNSGDSSPMVELQEGGQ